MNNNTLYYHNNGISHYYVCGGWKNVIQGHFNEVTPPAYRYAYLHTHAHAMQI